MSDQPLSDAPRPAIPPPVSLRPPAGEDKGGPGVMLTPTIQKAICDSLRAGCKIAASAEAAGISKSTFYKWRKRGEREITRLEAHPRARVREREFIYLEFAIEVREAIAKAQLALTLYVHKEAAKGDWRASAWLLARRWPKEFADRHEVTGAGGAALQTGQVILMMPDNGRDGQTLLPAPTAAPSEPDDEDDASPDETDDKI